MTSTGTPATSTATVTACKTTPTPGHPAGHRVGPSNTTISLTKSANVAVVKPGGTVRFTIHWKNTGKTAAKNVVICDKLPSGLTFSSAPGATFKSGKACWSRKSVAVGSEPDLRRRREGRRRRGLAHVHERRDRDGRATRRPRTATAKVRSLPQKSQAGWRHRLAI